MLSPLDALTRLVLPAVIACHAESQSLAGRLVDSNNIAIAGATVGMTSSGGLTATTNANGDFSITGLLNGVHPAEIDPRTPTVAPMEIDFTVNGATNVGTIVMEPGATVSGTVVSPSNIGLFGVNLNAYLPNGTKLFTPHDGTDINGNFQIVVPLVADLLIQALPPVGVSLLPFETTISVTSPVNLGLITLEQGYAVSGTIVDAVNFLPLGGSEIVTTNALTGEEIAQANKAANTFGIFSVVLPVGLHQFDIEPPALSLHSARQLFNVTVVGQAQNLGAIQLERAMLLSGSVTGPNGPVANADIDVISADGVKLFTPGDNTDINGIFSIRVPTGTYSVHVEPPLADMLAGRATSPVTVPAHTDIGIVALVPGLWLGLQVLDSNGQPVGHADLDLLDPVTGQSQVLVGDHANAQGYIAATIPAGTWDVRIETPQGSHAATLFVPVVTVAIPLLLTVALSDKDVVTDLQTYGVPTIGQGGSFPVNLSLENTTLSTMALAFEAFVRLPNGTHLPVAPTIPLDVPAQQLMGLVGSWVSIPVVPTNELGRQLRLRTRITDRTTGTVLDEAQVRFVVQ